MGPFGETSLDKKAHASVPANGLRNRMQSKLTGHTQTQTIGLKQCLERA
jgi:hypothetical protein